MNKIKKTENPDCTLTLVLLLKWKKVFLKGRMGVLCGRVWIRGSHSEDHPDGPERLQGGIWTNELDG